MQPLSKPAQLARFAVFEADLVTGELRKSGIRVKLQEQPFRVLALLLTNHGQLVRREQLRRELWSDSTFVDFDQGLATAIRKIREVLEDAAENPRFVETLPKRGYRFIAPVEWDRQEPVDEGAPQRAGIPQTVSHYRILEKLGEGGMGVVYKAEDSKLQRTVALKFLPSHGLEEEEHRARFQREAQAAAALDHPNICTVYEIDEAQGQTFLAMAHLEGSTVSQKVKQGPLRLAEALDIAIQAGEGLRAAHVKGIVHRDIKSANLMVSLQGQVKIMDFGLAQAADRSQLTKTDTLLGTPAYMSPEQAQRQPADRRTDIWSLGVVMYEMLTGQRPFEGEREEAVLYGIVHEEPAPIADGQEPIPIELEQVIAKALAKDRNDRYQGVGELLEDLRVLERQIESQGDSAKPSKKPITKAQREALARARRRRLAWALGIVAAAVVVTMAGVAVKNLLPTTEPPPEPLEILPFTTTEGDECCPAFSPDGNQIAFEWDGPQNDNSDIYVKLIGPGPPLRLTTDPRWEGSPAFSPDSREIAFGRALGSNMIALVVVPALGGPERVLSKGLAPSAGNLAWSPDGKYIVGPGLESADSNQQLFATSVENGKLKRLTNPPEQTFGDGTLALSPDGRTLAFVRRSGGAGTGYLLDLDENLEPQGEPRQLIPGQWNPGRLTWTADGTEIIFDSGHSGVASRLMRIAVEGGQAPRPLAGTGENATMPAISPQGNRLAFVRNTAAQAKIWRVRVAKTGGRAGAPTKLISSSRLDLVPRYSPDGEKIVFSSNRSVDLQIWISDADGANARRLTQRFNVAGAPHWSPDGEQIVFHGQTERGKDFDIYTMSARGGIAPRRLTTDPSADYVPIWSRDGRWIYFCSERGGSKQTAWRIPAEGGEATRLSGGQALNVRESLDGKFLYYIRYDGDGRWSIRRMVLDGGEDSLVVSAVGASGFEVVEEGIYFIAVHGPDGLHSILFFDFATEETAVVLASVERPAEGLSVSPDGKYILFARYDALNDDIMLVENFR